MNSSFPKIKEISIRGYKCFKDFTARLSELEVFVGANGSGKTSFFEFLKFLRDAIEDIPPDIIEGAIVQQIFHDLEQNIFQWQLQLDLNSSSDTTITYEGELAGPKEEPRIVFEKVESQAELCMEVRAGKGKEGRGVLAEPKTELRDVFEVPSDAAESENFISKSYLSLATPSYQTLYALRAYIEQWQFYNALSLNVAAVRDSALIEPEPFLDEDASNLTSVLHYLATEHPSCFEELANRLSSVVPGLENLSTKIVAPGRVLAFYRSGNRELSIADVSDGTLRLICWFCLCLHPDPPALICIDEPTQGIHPRALPLLAHLLEKASDRTQIFVATHSSYFLKQLNFSRIGVFRKSQGETQFSKPNESYDLPGLLEDFGCDELEEPYQSDELKNRSQTI